MSIRYRNANGDEVICAGLTPGGDIEAGAVMTRSGTFANETALANWAIEGKSITFDSPMPDADYELEFSYPHDVGYFVVREKTANGFNGYLQRTLDSQSAIGSLEVNYKATKTYTVQHAQQNAESIATLEAMVPTGAGSGNQLTTKSYVDNADSALDTRLDNLEDLIPVGASVTNQLVTASQASVDSAFSATSEHAVQNKVVKAALDAKQDTLTFDNTPTAGSDNPVKSGGIKTALDAKQNTLTFDTSPTSGSTNPVTSGGVYTALQDKADKVTSATAGNFAGLDASGNLVDSGKKASDFVSAANLDALNQIAAGVYEGTDLTVKYADEIADYPDEWAWVQARLDAHNLSGMLPGDYIPIVVGTETHQAQIAGINTYYDTCDSSYEVKYHIDWITRDCYGGATVKWNNSDNNNGSSAEVSPFLASNLNSWLNSTLYGLLEAKLKAVIKEKRILAPTRYQSGQSLTDDNAWVWKTTGKLWVPYETEIFDNVQWSTKGFGESQNVQYEIFRNSYRARKKKQGPTGARADWWTASAPSGNATYAVFVGSYGDSNSGGASSSRCAPVCFRTMATT